MTTLSNLDNSFDKENHVRCFNHTLQLSSKALLKPFNVGISKKTDEDLSIEHNDEPSLCDPNDDDVDVDNDDDDHEDHADEGEDVEDENEDDLTDAEKEELLANTLAIRETVSKVI